MFKIAICDDSKVDSAIIHEFVKEYANTKQLDLDVRIFNHPDELLQECEAFMPHIYILDIMMPMVTGIEAAKELRWKENSSQIIFVTSDPSFALESFSVNPINYLLKPVEKSRLFDTLDLSLRNIKWNEENTHTIKVRGGYETVRVRDILYLEYRNHVVTYHLRNHKEIQTTTIRISFADYIQSNLEGTKIILCHESFAVNLSSISMLSRFDVTLDDSEVVPVSKSRYKQVSELFKNQEGQK